MLPDAGSRTTLPPTPDPRKAATGRGRTVTHAWRRLARRRACHIRDPQGWIYEPHGRRGAIVEEEVVESVGEEGAVTKG